MKSVAKKPSRRRPPAVPAAGRRDVFAKIVGLAAGLRELQEAAVIQYTPIVESIIATRGRDVRHIEQILDGLLDFACHPAGLLLYRRLCRHYWDIDPAATVAYVNAYREMWGEGENLEPHTAPRKMRRSRS